LSDAFEGTSQLLSEGHLLVGNWQMTASATLLQTLAAHVVTASSDRAVLALGLSSGAIAETVKVGITAAPPAWQAVGAVAEVRAAAGQADQASATLIIDFQTLRTVSAFQPPPSRDVSEIRVWLGTEFSGDDITADASVAGSRIPFEEVQTERLHVTLDSEVSPGEFAESAMVHLPAPPADLELTVNGRQAWSFRGPVRKDAEQWNGYQTVVDVTAAVQQALNEGAEGVSVLLTALQPGVLELTQHTLEVVNAHSVLYPQGPIKTLVAQSEGRQQWVLPLPDEATQWRLKQIRLRLQGQPPAVRVLPPDGPLPLSDTELVLDPRHSAAVSLPQATLSGLKRLSGLRLPVAAGAGGAELTAILYSADDGRPGKALDPGRLGPVTVPEGDTPQWFSLSLDRPLDLSVSAELWAVLHVTRGRLLWPLAVSAANPGAAVLHGLPEGPFRTLPEVPEVAAEGFAAVLRLVGEPPEDSPLPALSLGFGDATISIPPSGDEVEAVLQLPPDTPGDTEITLDLLAFAPVTYKVSSTRVIYQPYGDEVQ
jgi:hypothetical protein